jgi:uncharacterized membrane protein YqaE (UPF0057 family)
MKKITPLFTFFFFSFALLFLPSHAAVVPKLSTTDNVIIKDSADLASALSEFRSLSRKDRRERFKEMKKEVKAFKAEKRKGAEPSTNTLLLVILAILLPPLAVYLHQGEINNKFWIDLLLTLLFFLPGVIYALIVILGEG